MSEKKRAPDPLFEKYLDNQLTGVEEDRLREALSREQEVEVDLQQQIDASLVRQFHVSEPSIAEIESWLEKPVARNPAQNPGWNARRTLLLVVACAAAALLMFLVFPRTQPTPFFAPFFEPRALTQLYSEAVDTGFKPYYFCEDEERFAETFAHRQGKRLVLAEMPEDRRMVGLSYLGGLSRSTTAILCIVDEQPVIVFVEQSELDNNNITDANEGLHVHREQRDGLVFYEVSPHATSRISPFLKHD